MMETMLDIGICENHVCGSVNTIRIRLFGLWKSIIDLGSECGHVEIENKLKKEHKKKIV